MTSLLTYNQFLLSKSNTTQIKEILSSQETEKIAPIACSGQGSKDLKIGKLWTIHRYEFKLHQKTEHDKVSQTRFWMFILSSSWQLPEPSDAPDYIGQLFINLIYDFISQKELAFIKRKNVL